MFLVVDGITVPVAHPQATKGTPERGGSTTRMYDGTLRSTVRYVKHTWTVTTKLLDPTDAAALEAISDDADFVDCSGDLLGGTVSCDVIVTSVAHQHTPQGLRRALTLTLRQV
jgi:hypothetical protein